METILFQTSLIASFIAGMVALFAPCCITFLLPAYLGSVFKEKEKVLLMTLIFGSGIFVVLLPAVLGIALISKTIFHYHDSIYFLGGLTMLFVSVITFLGIKLPMPQINGNSEKKTDALSIFIMGIFSGLTSACCAPVLVGILTMSFLSPSFFGAILIGIMYVLGMVTPLLLISLFLSGKMPNVSMLRKPLAEIKIFGKTFYLILSNMIAGAIFFVTAVLTLILNASGKLSMSNSEGVTKMIQNAGGFVNSLVGGNIFINILFLIAVGIFIYLISKKV